MWYVCIPKNTHDVSYLKADVTPFLRYVKLRVTNEFGYEFYRWSPNLSFSAIDVLGYIKRAMCKHRIRMCNKSPLQRVGFRLWQLNFVRGLSSAQLFWNMLCQSSCDQFWNWVVNCIGGLKSKASSHLRCLGTIEQCTKHMLKMCKESALDRDSSILLGDFLFASRGREIPGGPIRKLSLARAAASNSRGDREHVNIEYVFSFCHDMSLVAWKYTRGSFRHRRFVVF